MTFGEFVREGVQNYQEKERQMKLYGYYNQIMEEDGCSMEEAVRKTIEEPMYIIGVKMIDYGLTNLSTKKGRLRFRNTVLTPEEAVIWDDPERPDHFVRLIGGATRIMTKKGTKMVKEVFRHEKN